MFCSEINKITACLLFVAAVCPEYNVKNIVFKAKKNQNLNKIFNTKKKLEVCNNNQFIYIYVDDKNYSYEK